MQAIDEVLTDLVIETIAEWFALSTEESEWWKVVTISKRWKRLSVPILRRVHSSRWPRFVQEITSNPVLTNSKGDTVVTRGKTSTYTYAWAFSSGVPLPPQTSASPVCAEVVFSQSGGTYIGVAILPGHGFTKHDKVLEWGPHDNRFPPIPPPCIICVLGLGSGYVYLVQDPRPNSPTLFSNTGCNGGPSCFVWYQPGQISFLATDGALVRVKVDETVMRSLENATVHVIAGMANEKTTATVKEGPRNVGSLHFNKVTELK